jgi:hypothetical protein
VASKTAYLSWSTLAIKHAWPFEAGMNEGMSSVLSAYIWDLLTTRLEDNQGITKSLTRPRRVVAPVIGRSTLKGVTDHS